MPVRRVGVAWRVQVPSPIVPGCLSVHMHYRGCVQAVCGVKWRHRGPSTPTDIVNFIFFGELHWFFGELHWFPLISIDFQWFPRFSSISIGCWWCCVVKWDVSATVRDACEVPDGAGHCLRAPLATQTTPYHVGRTNRRQPHPTRPQASREKKVHEKLVLKRNKNIYIYLKI